MTNEHGASVIISGAIGGIARWGVSVPARIGFNPIDEFRDAANGIRLNCVIIINEDAALNDTMHIINYSNSYDKIARKVKVIQRNGNWLVDFKYTFNGNL